MTKSFMEQVVDKLKTVKGKEYHASNGISFFLNEHDVLFYITLEAGPFTLDMLQAAREEFLFKSNLV